jgi:hypothetical protein
MVYSFRVGPYARSVYVYGTQSFQDVPLEYHQPVKEYAAKNFSQYQLDQALQSGYITQQEYDETILLIPT